MGHGEYLTSEACDAGLIPPCVSRAFSPHVYADPGVAGNTPYLSANRQPDPIWLRLAKLAESVGLEHSVTASEHTSRDCRLQIADGRSFF
jgi:hypothetical protein